MRTIFSFLAIFISLPLCGQDLEIAVDVDFSKPLHTWDGFGVNYVETSQTMDYAAYPQDYGGFSILRKEDKGRILDSIFGDNGLRINILKMFLDPWHQMEPGGNYDHETSTKNMLFVATEALQRIRARKENMEILTTLYGPPAYMSTINALRGKELDPLHEDDLGRYITDWTRFLLYEKELPVKYVSLHNEGEDWGRMPVDGGPENATHLHLDYNLYWSPDQTVKFLKSMKPMLDSAGLGVVKLTPGEYTNWYRFNSMGYARAIYEDSAALANLGLITSHGFYNGRFWRLFSGTTNHGTWLLQERKPELHAWTTSMSWMNSSIEFVNLIYYHIYLARVNAIIPWAFIQRPELWANGDPNPGNAVTVRRDSTWYFTPGYFLYKQVTRAGRPGMKVVHTSSMDPSVLVMGFTKADTREKDSFVIINNGYSFAHIADALIVSLTLGETTAKYHLSHKAATETAADLPENVRFITRETPEGYTLEAAIPWASTPLSSMKDIDGMKADVVIRSGAEDVENIVGWSESSENKIKPPLLAQTSSAPAIDGAKEAFWDAQPVSDINHPRLDGGRFALSGNIRFAYDTEFLYLFAEIEDPTNKKNKQLRIHPLGIKADSYKAYRTSFDGEKYMYIGEYVTDSQGTFLYEAPGNSVTTFFAED